MFSVGWHAVEMTTSANRRSASALPVGPALLAEPPALRPAHTASVRGEDSGAPPRPRRGEGRPTSQRHAGAAAKLAGWTSHPPHLGQGCPRTSVGPEAPSGGLCKPTQGGDSRSRHELPPASGRSVRS